MIYSMLEQSFSRFGTTDPGQTEHKKPLNSVKLQRREAVALFCFATDTLWDYDSGMTVLLILQEETPVRYYLDRRVKILAGTVFGFYPMGEESSIYSDVAAEQAPCREFSLQETGQQISTMEIFTRLPQNSMGGLYFRGERHKPMELVYVEKGTIYNYCEGQQIVLHPGQLMLIGSDQWHMQYAKEDVQFLTVSFVWEDHDFGDRLCQAIHTTEDMHRCISALQQTVEHEDAEEFYQAQLKLLLIHILQQPLQKDKKKKALPASERAHLDVMDRAMQAVSAGITQRLTVAKLAAEVNVSASQLTTLFQTYLGLPPARYITRVRLEESKRLLTQGHLSVGEVARRLGYASVQHFSRQFTQWYGCTPTAYVKMSHR